MDIHLPTASRSFGLIASVPCTPGRCASPAPLHRAPLRRESRLTMSVAAPKNSAPQSAQVTTPYSDPHVEVRIEKVDALFHTHGCP